MRDDPTVFYQRVGSDSAHLTFEASGTDELTVTFKSGGSEMSVVAYETSSGLQHLADYFASMAKDWSGWSGAREWASLEGDVKLSATHDRLVSIRFEISPLTVDTGFWRTTGVVPIEPGEQLSSVASGMSDLFGS